MDITGQPILLTALVSEDAEEESELPKTLEGAALVLPDLSGHLLEGAPISRDRMTKLLEVNGIQFHDTRDGRLRIILPSLGHVGNPRFALRLIEAMHRTGMSVPVAYARMGKVRLVEAASPSFMALVREQMPGLTDLHLIPVLDGQLATRQHQSIGSSSETGFRLFARRDPATHALRIYASSTALQEFGMRSKLHIWA